MFCRVFLYISVLFSDYLVLILKGKVVTVKIASPEETLHLVFVQIYLTGIAPEIFIKDVMRAHFATAFNFAHNIVTLIDIVIQICDYFFSFAGKNIVENRVVIRNASAGRNFVFFFLYGAHNALSESDKLTAEYNHNQ